MSTKIYLRARYSHQKSHIYYLRACNSVGFFLPTSRFLPKVRFYLYICVCVVQLFYKLFGSFLPPVQCSVL